MLCGRDMERERFKKQLIYDIIRNDDTLRFKLIDTTDLDSDDNPQNSGRTITIESIDIDEIMKKKYPCCTMKKCMAVYCFIMCMLCLFSIVIFIPWGSNTKEVEIKGIDKKTFLTYIEKLNRRPNF